MNVARKLNASKKWLQRAQLGALISAGLLLSHPATATIVRLQTSLGDVEINLFDRGTPATVANFLAYVNANAYANNVVHRSVPGFVIQGGGYSYAGSLPLNAVTERAAVTNEPIYSNLRGTIAMAKIGSNPNSATSQWFVNLANNSANLDQQNGGFTVFGQVIGNGMMVIDAIAALNRFNLGGGLDTMPLRNYTNTDATANTPVTGTHLMLIQNVIIVDANLDSAAALTPARNTLITTPPADDSSGGGSLGLASLLALGLLALSRKRIKAGRADPAR